MNQVTIKMVPVTLEKKFIKMNLFPTSKCSTRWGSHTHLLKQHEAQSEKMKKKKESKQSQTKSLRLILGKGKRKREAKCKAKEN